MKRKSLVAALALASVMNAHSEEAFDQFLVFGDSLLDSGNFGAPFTNAGAQIAPNLLADELGLDLAPAITDPNGTNYAVGGYETPDILNSINGTGITTGLGSRNAYLTDNPSISADTLILIDGGGNDFNPGGAIDWGAAPDPAAAIQGSAQTLVASVTALSNAGARYILLANLPDLGQVPAVQALNLGTPGTAAAATDAAAGFNTALTLFTQATNIPVIPVDLAGVIQLITRDAEALGFANGALGGLPVDQLATCYNDIGGDCIEHPIYGIDGTAPDPDRLVYNDGLHPTGATGRLTADYLYDIIVAPRKVALLAEMGEGTARGQLNTVRDEMRQSRWSTPSNGWFISGAIAQADFDGGLDAEDDNYSSTIGLTHRMADDKLLGVALTVSGSELDSDDTSFEAISYGANVFYGYRAGSWFVDGVLGFTIVDYHDLSRDFRFGSQTYEAEGDTDGTVLSIDISAGYNVMADSESIAFGPIVGIQSIHTTVTGYEESGGEVSNYDWAEQSVKSQQWRVGVTGDFKVSDTFRLSGEIYASGELEDGWREVEATNTNLGFGSYRLPGTYVEDDTFVNASINGTFDLEAGKVRVAYHYSGENDDSGRFSVTYSAPF